MEHNNMVVLVTSFSPLIAHFLDRYRY